MRAKLAALEKRIAELEAEVARLKATPPVQHHYHYEWPKLPQYEWPKLPQYIPCSPTYVPQPTFPPIMPQPTWIAAGTSCLA